MERRIEQSEPRIKYLNQTKYLQLLSFNSQITNEISMPGELWHAPEANFYFRINNFFQLSNEYLNMNVTLIV